MTNPLPTFPRLIQTGFITVATALLSLAAASSARAQAPGSLDAMDVSIVGTNVYATAVQADGKTIIAGSFSSVMGVPRSNIARINADGSLDSAFDPKSDSEVRCVTVQADGKILLGGLFTTLQPNGAAVATARNRIARVNADGSLDSAFDPKPNSNVHSLAIQTDGKILLGGDFTTLKPNGTETAIARKYVARVNTDGSLDTNFDPNADSWLRSLAVQTDGKILLGGYFTALQPNGAAVATARNRIARVNADGSLDSAFDPNADSYVNSVVVQADGKILLGGAFVTLQPNGAAGATTRNRIARVNADGSLDTAFDPKTNSNVWSIAVQADGKILLGGNFTTFQPNGAATTTVRISIARVNADGSLDSAFNPRANSSVYSIAVQAGGKILLGGLFTALQPNGATSATARHLFARLNNDTATQTLSAPDATQVLWQRGGATPEVSQVTFEQSADGGTSWTALGTCSRVGITSNWQLTGLTLPANCQLRAYGRTVGGYNNGTSGLVESRTNVGPDSDNDGLLDSWELTYWPTTTCHTALDDSDHDGYCELLELALGLNPTLPSVGGLPAAINEDGYLTMTITKQAGVTYEVQSAGSLLPALPDSFTASTTTVLTNDTTTLKVRDNFLIGTTPAHFLRVKVTAAP